MRTGPVGSHYVTSPVRSDLTRGLRTISSELKGSRSHRVGGETRAALESLLTDLE
ncbi:hypothetical protein BH23ACT10_BH23ACT10_04680 [soil metagenome]